MKTLNKRIMVVLHRNGILGSARNIRSVEIIKGAKAYTLRDRMDVFVMPAANIWLRIREEQDPWVLVAITHFARDDPFTREHPSSNGYSLALAYVGSHTECEIGKKMIEHAIAKDFMTRG